MKSFGRCCAALAGPIALTIGCVALAMVVCVAPGHAGKKEVKLACVLGDATEDKDALRVGDIYAEAGLFKGMQGKGSLTHECEQKYPGACNGKCWACKKYDEKWLGMSNMGCYSSSGKCSGWCGPPY